MSWRHFGVFNLDLVAHELFKKGKRIHLTPKEVAVLELLSSQPLKPFSRTEIEEKVWKEQIETGDMIDEGTLAVHVVSIRRALSDNARAPAYIENLPKRGDWPGGYTFIASAVETDDPEPALVADIATATGGAQGVSKRALDGAPNEDIAHAELTSANHRNEQPTERLVPNPQAPENPQGSGLKAAITIDPPRESYWTLSYGRAQGHQSRRPRVLVLVALGVAALLGLVTYRFFVHESSRVGSPRVSDTSTRLVNQLRTDYREALHSSGVPDFSRANADLASLKQLDSNNGLVWYYSGEIKRLSNPSLFTIGSCPTRWSSPPNFDLYHWDFYRYLEGATRRPSVEMTDPGLEVCYENPSGYCLQWTTWIYHLMANDFYQAALVNPNEVEQTKQFEKAYDFAVKATQYHAPEGGQGFDQCVNTQALIEILRDKLHPPGARSGPTGSH